MTLKNIVKKITSSNKIPSNKILGEICLINDEIEYFEKLIRNQKPSCLSEDMKRADELTNLYSIKIAINKRHRQYIISQLNEFPLNKACSKDFICDKINISFYEFSMVMFTDQEHKFTHYKPIKKNGKSYYHSGIYDDGTTIINNEYLKIDCCCLICYKKILSGWKVIEFNETHYYERIDNDTTII
jgi:hypothetical protein